MSTEEKAVHTLGPWEIIGATQVVKFGEDWACIAEMSNPRSESEKQQHSRAHVHERSEPWRDKRFHEAAANARLIASATELPHQCEDPNCHGGKLYQQHCLEIIRLGELEAVNKELLQALGAMLSDKIIDGVGARIRDHARETNTVNPIEQAEALIAKARGIR